MFVNIDYFEILTIGAAIIMPLHHKDYITWNLKMLLLFDYCRYLNLKWGILKAKWEYAFYQLCCSNNFCGQDQNELSNCQLTAVTLKTEKTTGMMSLSKKSKDNEMLVKHIRTTSNLNENLKSNIKLDNATRVRQLKDIAQDALTLRLKVFYLFR